MNMHKDREGGNVPYKGTFGSSLTNEGGLHIHLANTSNTDKGFSFIYKKTEKITAAVYLMSDKLSDSEPIKDNIRKLVLNNLRDVSSIVKKDRSGSQKSVDVLKGNVMQLISLLDVGQFAGLFSEMNCSVLKRELSDLISSIEQYISPDSPSFGSDHFYVGDTHPSIPQKKALRTNGASSSRTQRKDSAFAHSSKGQISSGQLNNGNGSNGSRVMQKSNEKKEQRRTTLLSLIKRKGEITVSDAADVISECSQKTLQRELLSLVDEGVLKKEGERRWSRYSFAL